jgi:SAM-dependent methyltransferase
VKFIARKFTPYTAGKILWGDRKKWGLQVRENDPCWTEWLKVYSTFYNQNQREGIGTKVNDAGYRVMQQVDLTGKKVLEIGAGDIRHTAFWKSQPSEYLLADVSADMMEKAESRLKQKKVPYQSFILTRTEKLPLEDNSVDIVVSFYSLEHLYPLSPYLDEMHRVVKPGGLIVGAIPAEGGLAWGLGRALTSRRWFKKHTSIDPDKIICWEHPNFADEILTAMDVMFVRQQLGYWPFRVPLIDPNLVIKFIYKNAEK